MLSKTDVSSKCRGTYDEDLIYTVNGEEMTNQVKVSSLQSLGVSYPLLWVIISTSRKCTRGKVKLTVLALPLLLPLPPPQ
jgi:hypothetical protein